MKKLLLILTILVSCSKSEVLMELPQIESKDTIYVPKTKTQDTTEWHPIRFDIHLTDWEDYDI